MEQMSNMKVKTETLLQGIEGMMLQGMMLNKASKIFC